MKVVILAGGLGTRLSEHTEVRPKPMVEVGDRPILWHIMQRYARFGFNEFVVALGYKGDAIKRYFHDYCALRGRMTVRLRDGAIGVVERDAEDWTIHLVDTGVDVMTGGRLKRVGPLIEDGTFLLTYGDGLADLDIDELVACHRRHGRLATITAVRPPARFGGLIFDEPEEQQGDLGTRVREFTEKPQIGEGWINGGFMVLEPEVLERLEGDEAVLESHLLEQLAREGQLTAYRHRGFWQCMDTIRDLNVLQALWKSGAPPWRA